MRSHTPLRLALLCLIALAAGCSSHNKGKLEGTWESEATTITKGNKEVKLPKGARVITFGKDGKKDDPLTYEVLDDKNEPRTLKGKWECSSGYYVTLTFDETLNDRKQHVEKIIVSDDGRTMTMTDSDGTSVTFTKKILVKVKASE